jgi:hypothetical protein
MRGACCSGDARARGDGGGGGGVCSFPGHYIIASIDLAWTAHWVWLCAACLSFRDTHPPLPLLPLFTTHTSLLESPPPSPPFLHHRRHRRFWLREYWEARGPRTAVGGTGFGALNHQLLPAALHCTAAAFSAISPAYLSLLARHYRLALLCAPNLAGSDRRLVIAQLQRLQRALHSRLQTPTLFRLLLASV